MYNIDELRRQIKRCRANTLLEALQDDSSIVVDVREDIEVSAGKIDQAIHIPLNQLESVACDLLEKQKKIYIYCAAGQRSLVAAKILSEMGFEAISCDDGYSSLKMDRAQSAEQIELHKKLHRYQRQILLPEVGQDGQKKLLESKILIVGMGGIGCPVAQYLAATGIGTLALMDSDIVEETNLHRQILYSTDDIGKEKVVTAAEKLVALNPQVEIIKIPQRFDAQVATLVAEFDIVIDGTDNFHSRYLISDACSEHRKPLVQGAVNRFEGSLSVFFPQYGGSLRSIFPQEPPADLVPPCAQGGVLGVLPGTIGLLAASEAIKILLGLHEQELGDCSGWFIRYDARTLSFSKMVIPRC